ncbi:MAG TPA: alpha-(1-_3)-arabinofuranosyltransferase family protein [Nocardioides sp.]|nr:alpha-(1->3)-arabinofuranosyltransferase family protein [Nocardioides sp.]
MTDHQQPARAGVATSRLRMWGYAAILTAMAFSQSAGKMVADTKFDLLTGPLKFLAGGLRLWDPSAAFGQIQNQAYGYAWPMGPFFLVGNWLQLPPWVIQRMWWSLLLCLAFFGVVRLAQRLSLGTPTTQVLAGFAFVLTPRITTLLGGTSVEVWPMALAPWVLIPLVRGAERGSVRRAAAWSALAVACCGGVNAIAVAAVLPLGVIFILTRARGRRRWPLLGWWTLFTVMATLWWSAPLLFLGRYSVPFLDYIENATITTVPTDLARTVLGQSDWVAYFAGIDYPAGQQLVTTPFLMLDAAVVAGFGLVGIAMRSNPHQRFLTWGLLTGLVLVGFGYADELAGFLAADRVSWLDGPLAALRNLHKFDVVLRIPLVLGLAHALAVVAGHARDRATTWSARFLQAAAVLAVVALALPWSQDRIAPREGVVAVPDYWSEVADYLHDTDDGTVALEVPATTFGIYDWGNVHDDVLQGLADSPWAVRNVIPLAQPGNVAFLDAIGRAVESGHPSTTLAPFLAENGVGRLVVRNDLDRFQTGAPDPAYVRSVLIHSPGITLAESFGPEVGARAWTYSPGGNVRVVEGSGISAVTGSVDVYDVDGAAAATVTPTPQVLVGDPGTGLDRGMAELGPGPRVLAEDAGGGEQGEVLTDGTKRREVNFAAVRYNQSATMPANEPYRLRGPEKAHRFLEHPERWQTTESWARNVVQVTASTSQAYADAQPPLEIGTHPGAALDSDPATQWKSARHLDPTGQWWQETFSDPTFLDTVKVTIGRDSAPVQELQIQADGQSRVVPAPRPGQARTYGLDFDGATFLRITAAGRDLRLPGSFALAEVEVPGVAAQRYLNLPVPDDRFPLDAISMTRDPDRAPCVMIGATYACDESLISPGEDGDTLARRFIPPYQSTYQLSATASLRRTVDASLLLSSGIAVTSDAPVHDVATSPVALGDGDLATTWIADDRSEVVHLALPETRTLGTMRLQVNAGAAAALPRELLLRAGNRHRTVVVDGQGEVRLPHWRTDELDLQVTDTKTAVATYGREFVRLPAGISELELDGEPLNSDPLAERRFPCGTGPQITVAGQLRDTSLRASTRDLIRGATVPLRICGSPDILLTQQATSLLALPNPLFRFDSATLAHENVPVRPPAPVDVAHTGNGTPREVDLPARPRASVLTLPQNVNAGWQATLGGKRLDAVRMDGWKQGWRVPAGESGTVSLSYRPALPFTILFIAGVVMALVVLAIAVWPRRRPVAAQAPPLAAGRPGVPDLVVVLGAGALLAGWWGLAGVAAGLVLGLAMRRFAGWPWLAGGALVTGALALSTDRLTRQSWAVSWSQAWLLAAVCLTVAALAARRVRE